MGIILSVTLYFAVKGKADMVAEEKFQEAIAAMDFYAHLSYKKVKVNLFGMDVHILGVIISPHESRENIYIDEIVVYKMDDKNDFPHFAHVKLKGFHSETPKIDETFFSRHGLAESPKVDIELNYVYEKHQRAFRFRQFSYGSESLGTLNINYLISNVDLDAENQRILGSTFPNILLHKAEIRLRNGTLFEKIIQSIAQKEGKEVAEFKQEIREFIEDEETRTENAFYLEVLQVLKEFIENPDAIIIDLAPETPISLDRILETRNLGETIKLLNVKVRT